MISDTARLMAGRFQAISALAALLFAAGCNGGFVHDETLAGPYRLVAVDIDEDMSICWSIPGADGSCSGDGLPGPTVYAAGSDDKYLVAAVHPNPSGVDPNKSVTHYYYVVRSRDEWKQMPYAGVYGPMNEAKFNAEKVRLRLPEFNRVFNHLR